MTKTIDYSSQISIIIPAYNEEDSLETTISSILSDPRLTNAEIIIVDDGSTDQTASVVSTFKQVQLYKHRINLGYGAAISTGIRRSTRPCLIWFDADGQHRVEDLVKIMYALIDSKLDYCVGTRQQGSHHVANRWLGKTILRLVVRLAAGQPIEDFNSGLRGFRRNVIISYLHLLPKGFSASTTTSLLMLERNHLGKNIPIIANKRIGQSSVKQFRDGFRTILIILRVLLLFKPLFFFGSIGFLLILFGITYGFSLAFTTGRGFPVLAALSIILGIQSLFFGLLNDQISQMRREKFEVIESQK